MSIRHHVLVTRPAAQAPSLCQRITALGHQAYSIPLLEIIPLERQHASPVGGVVIFMSANAVRYFPAEQLTPEARVFAIGAATGAALIERGIKIVAIPAEASSEGLLALPELQAVIPDKVTIVSGLGGRQLLAQTLLRRGIPCEQIAVYERRPLKVQQPLQRLIVDAPISHVIVSSGEGAQYFLQLMENAPDQLQALTLIVISQRVAEKARAAGFKGNIKVAKQANDVGLCNAL